MRLRLHRASEWLAASLLALTTLLSACGDGSDGLLTAGIEGTGVVSGFGSVFVNGIEFSTDEAVILQNGIPVTENGLRVGDVVTLRGTTDENGRARATSIAFDRVVDGPIEFINLSEGEGTLRALDQTVRVDGNTRFINTTAEQLQAGDLIAVSGLPDDNAVVRATSIERAGFDYVPGSTRIDVEGFVSGLQDGAGQFNIGALAVDFGNASVLETAGPLANGAYVEVFGLQGAADGAPLVADRVEVRPRAVGRAGEQVSIDAVITDFSSLADFRLNGQRVDASGARRLDNSGIAPGNGVRVQINGIFTGTQIAADNLTVRPAPEARLAGRVDSVDPAGNRFLIFGQAAGVLAQTLYLDSSSVNNRQFRIGSLRPGDSVAAAGYLDTQGSLVVTRLERLDGQAASRVTAPLQQADAAAGTLRAANVVVRSNAGTVFRDRNGNTQSAGAFFAALQNGDTVTAKGSANASEINPAAEIRRLD